MYYISYFAGKTLQPVISTLSAHTASVEVSIFPESCTRATGMQITTPLHVFAPSLGAKLLQPITVFERAILQVCIHLLHTVHCKHPTAPIQFHCKVLQR